ncbi:LysM peptidoglycan-binding domain-containing protein [Lactobacillus sp. 3B(2020)]|uniref:aggregation-promoting factor n=1 Tax=Lactobacillus sp. 3B(2020) TaxID=2695882 RepID=UPI0015DF6F64|nr:LysM domain-containing protein [Lactobacillus sp. 3B(2020)]QLL70533.1 LysM peptidoglycan-binding domain-containing protein [Lactobacillus sp. 3B(2020)]
MLKKSMLTTVATLGIAAFGIAAGTSVANADSIYTVQAGDTLSSISQKFAKDNSLVNKLAQDNNIQDVNLIYVGQKLLIKDNGQIQVASQQDVANNQAATNNAATNTATTSQASATTATNNSSSYTSSVSGSEAAAKAWIAARESGGSYTAQNGQYYGKYQLSSSYLGGDYSAANQERVADQYVASRYGSWTAAQAFWQANGWY